MTKNLLTFQEIICFCKVSFANIVALTLFVKQAWMNQKLTVLGQIDA
jgi:hypothetical protein